MGDNNHKVLDPGPIKRMLEVTPKAGRGYNVIINPSSLDMIQTCLRKSQYQLKDGLVPREPALATTFGKGIHKFLEIFYATPREERTVPPKYKDRIMAMVSGTTLEDEEHFIYKGVRGFIEETQDVLGGLPSEDKRSMENGGWLMGEYVESRITDPYEVFMLDGEPCIEKMYEATLYDTPELTIRVHGTVDCLLQNKANDSLVICDHKTSSASNMNDFYNRTKPNYQYSMYVWLIEEIYKLGIENFMINVFQVKPRPKTSRGAGPNFLHILTKRTPEDIEEMRRGVVFYVEQYLKCLEDDYFPLSTSNACANYGKCAFLKVCESPIVIREDILKADYMVRDHTV